MASGGSESILEVNKQPTCNYRGTNPASILSVVGDDTPGLFPISIDDHGLRVCLLRLLSEYISQSFMKPLREIRVELHRYRSTCCQGDLNITLRCISYHPHQLRNPPPDIPSCGRRRRYHTHLDQLLVVRSIAQGHGRIGALQESWTGHRNG